MLKDYNSRSIFSEFSRKGAKKGSKDLSLLYAFDPEGMEPIATKPYVCNMLDMTVIDNFVDDYKITSGIMVFDKGFPLGFPLFNSPTLQLVLFLMWHKVNVQFSMWVLPCRKHSRLYEKD